jgi:hypothetical protein
VYFCNIISNEIEVNVLGERYQINACGIDEAFLGEGPLLGSFKYYNL